MVPWGYSIFTCNNDLSAVRLSSCFSGCGEKSLLYNLSKKELDRDCPKCTLLIYWVNYSGVTPGMNFALAVWITNTCFAQMVIPLSLFLDLKESSPWYKATQYQRPKRPKHQVMQSISTWASMCGIFMVSHTKQADSYTSLWNNGPSDSI